MALTASRERALLPGGKRDRVLASAIGGLLLAGLVVVAVEEPAPVLAALAIAPAAIALVRFPIVALGGLLFLQPFHTAIFTAISAKANIAPGALSFWKDAVILALFVRAVAERLRRDRELPVRDAGDNLLFLYILAYCLIAAASPARTSVGPALARYVEGPLILLAIRLFRPTRKELMGLVGATLAAASIIGIAAVYEQLGPRLDFQRWYGGQPGPNGEPFRIGQSGYRSGSFLYDPLILGFYLSGAAPLALALVGPRTRWRIAAFVAVAACVGGLIATATRSGYIGGALGVVAALGLTARNAVIRLSLVGLAVIIAGAVSISFIAVGSETFVRPESDAGHREALERDFRLLEARPFGYGLGTTDRFRFGAEAGEGQLGATENQYLATSLEGGIHGLVLYLAALFAVAMGVRGVRLRSIRLGDKRGTALAAGALGTMVGIAVSGLFLGVHELVVEALLWGMPGIALAWPIEPEP